MTKEQIIKLKNYKKEELIQIILNMEERQKFEIYIINRLINEIKNKEDIIQILNSKIKG